MKRIAVAALFLFIAAFALADGRENRGHMNRTLNDLDLSDAQKEQIKQLQSQFREASREASEAARAATKAYREAKRAGDTAKMAALRPQVEATREELRNLRKALNEQIRALLTPEQQKKWDEGKRGKRRRE